VINKSESSGKKKNLTTALHWAAVATPDRPTQALQGNKDFYNSGYSIPVYPLHQQTLSIAHKKISFERISENVVTDRKFTL